MGIPEIRSCPYILNGKTYKHADWAMGLRMPEISFPTEIRERMLKSVINANAAVKHY